MNSGSEGRLRAYFEIIRPKQWYKNLLLFVGLVFSRNLTDADMVLSSVLGFLAFCAISGAVYILNDIVDRDRDKAHPKKSMRPIPSGRMSLAQAAVYGALLAICGLAAAFTIGTLFVFSALAYAAVAISYSLLLKNVVILDAIVVAVGFVVRALAGTLAIDVPVSPWLIICVFLLALFLAFGKRRHELAVLGDDAADHREILGHYSTRMVDDMMLIATSTLIMAYSMYTFLATNQYMMLTIPFATFGVLRYLFLVHDSGEGGEPELIFKDVPTVVNMALWLLAVVAILYFAPEPSTILGG